MYYAPNGGIAPDGVLQAGYITFENMAAYNDALTAVQQTQFYSAEDFVRNNQDTAQQNMEGAVDDFVAATLAIVEILAIQEQAEIASNTGSIADQEALQDFISTNEVFLTETEIQEYNSAITEIEQYGNQYASFTAVLSNDEYMAEFQSARDDYNNSFLDAVLAFDAVAGQMTLGWDNVTVAVDMSQYYKTADEYYLAGQGTSFYTTSPIGCGYDFSKCE